jgi:hypothetical protein
MTGGLTVLRATPMVRFLRIASGDEASKETWSG